MEEDSLSKTSLTTASGKGGLNRSWRCKGSWALSLHPEPVEETQSELKTIGLRKGVKWATLAKGSKALRSLHTTHPAATCKKLGCLPPIATLSPTRGRGKGRWPPHQVCSAATAPAAERERHALDTSLPLCSSRLANGNSGTPCQEWQECVCRS